MLKSINLCLSSVCSANCIFCPSDRGKNIKTKIMPFECLKKIVDEMSSENFRRKHNVDSIIIGENGDALLNKDFIAMLRYIHSNLPNIKVVLYTNFKHLGADKIETILKEGLVSLVRTNIDGSTPENYYNAKRLNIEDTDENIRASILLRKKYKSCVPLYISILTLNKYIHTILKNYKFYPSKLTDRGLINIKDDFGAIKRKYARVIDKQLDKIFNIYGAFGWAERGQIDKNKINYKKYACPNIIRIRHEAFIAPDGTWYACCFDSANELTLGNVWEKSMEEVYSSEKRKMLIQLLKNQEFKKIGGPCATVNCCQIMHKNRLISTFFRLLFKNKFVTKFLYYKYNYRKMDRAEKK
jgi:radical SAM protein with 4Fe4S-binding SPASM domain